MATGSDIAGDVASKIKNIDGKFAYTREVMDDGVLGNVARGSALNVLPKLLVQKEFTCSGSCKDGGIYTGYAVRMEKVKQNGQGQADCRNDDEEEVEEFYAEPDPRTLKTKVNDKGASTPVDMDDNVSRDFVATGCEWLSTSGLVGCTCQGRYGAEADEAQKTLDMDFWTSYFTSGLREDASECIPLFAFLTMLCQASRNRIDCVTTSEGVCLDGDQLSDEEALHMIRDISNQEVRDAMFSIGDNKAPGPDGYSSEMKRGKAKIGNGQRTSTWYDNWSPLGQLSNVISNRDIYSAGFKLEYAVSGYIKGWDVGLATDEFRNCIQSRNAEVNWFHIVWFSQRIPRHAIHLWLVVIRSMKQLRFDSEAVGCEVFGCSSKVAGACPEASLVWMGYA
ncbi:hypothetical protein Tco_0863955 [Tanacetum coccineum]